VDCVSPHTLVFYESPYRLAGFLADALAVYGDRPAAIANDLTKRFERVQRGNLSSLLISLEKSEPKGEYTVVIGGATLSEENPEPDNE
jgi:16S rRNA (cytidine1402-2'-O)-methyltransferase